MKEQPAYKMKNIESIVFKGKDGSEFTIWPLSQPTDSQGEGESMEIKNEEDD